MATIRFLCITADVASTFLRISNHNSRQRCSQFSIFSLALMQTDNEHVVFI